MPFDREAMCKAWPKLAGPLKRLEKWQSGGIILECDRESAFEAAISLAGHIGGHLEKFESHPILKKDWEERAGRWLSGKLPAAGLYEAKKDRICALVLDLDRQPEWLQLSVRMPLDGGTPPGVGYVLIATAENAKEIPPEVRTFFSVVRKTGARRGPRGGVQR